jgi:hypothetical protein
MKNFNIDNFLKGPMTSLLGFSVMVASVIFWFMDKIETEHAAGASAVGFVLLFMKDQMPGFISKWFNKKIE